MTFLKVGERLVRPFFGPTALRDVRAPSKRYERSARDEPEARAERGMARGFGTESGELRPLLGRPEHVGNAAVPGRRGRRNLRESAVEDSVAEMRSSPAEWAERIARTSSVSCFVTRECDVPLLPARAVLPQRWMYSAADFGKSNCTT
mmetsp:Transcript_52588/g.87288  ORF Transcript_52588/g.87288 Transcript_52588/m.87288 type:complete len:148 (+) Transcript_52588:338-781(+)